VDDDRDTVTRPLDVEFDLIDARRDAGLERGEGVLGREGRRAAVADDPDRANGCRPAP
jgi:hypothetical protein